MSLTRQYRAHTTCITEDQKVQGKLYKPKQQQQQYQNKNIAAVKPASTNTITPTSCIAKEPTSSLSLIDQIKEKTVAAAAKDTSLEEPSKSEEDGEMSSLTKKRKATTEEAVSSPTKQKKKNKKSKKRSSEEDSSAAAGVVDANGDAVGVVDGWDESTWSFTSKAEGVKAAIRRVLSKVREEREQGGSERRDRIFDCFY